MASVLIAGGGLAGLSAAAALGGAGFQVEVFEARPFVGGRAASYPLGEETIDNCQHMLLRCCVNLLDFYSRLGVRDRIPFIASSTSSSRAGAFRRSAAREAAGAAAFRRVLSAAAMPGLGDKIGIARALRRLRRERIAAPGPGPDQHARLALEKRQTPRAIDRFWRQVLVSAVNEELDRMAAAHGFQVFWLGFLARADAYEMGLPAVPLAELYRRGRVEADGGRARSPARARGAIDAEGFMVGANGARPIITSARCPSSGWRRWAWRRRHSSIRRSRGPPVVRQRSDTLPHATLLDRTMQWMFNKDRGRYLQLVVSASRGADPFVQGGKLIEMAVLAIFGCSFRRVREANLVKAHVIKEQRATFSAAPGTEALRPGPECGIPNLFFAGDWIGEVGRRPWKGL